MTTSQKSRVVFLDTETTGLEDDAGIVEIGIVDAQGEILLQSLVNPWPHKTWNEAMRFHKITPEMVRHAPLIHDLWPVIFRMIQGAEVVIYNSAYDCKLFPNGNLRHADDISCAMMRFGAIEGTRSQRGDGFKWWKLVDAARIVGHDWGDGKAHRAIADCLAARSVWNWCDAKVAEKLANEVVKA